MDADLYSSTKYILNVLKTKSMPYIQEFHLKLEEFLKIYGERGYTREPYYPRWNESPSLIIDIIKSLIIDNEPLAINEKSNQINPCWPGFLKYHLFSNFLRRIAKSHFIYFLSLMQN